VKILVHLIDRIMSLRHRTYQHSKGTKYAAHRRKALLQEHRDIRRFVSGISTPDSSRQEYRLGSVVTCQYHPPFGTGLFPSPLSQPLTLSLFLLNMASFVSSYLLLYEFIVLCQGGKWDFQKKK
jgi:hypothetical protein